MSDAMRRAVCYPERARRASFTGVLGLVLMVGLCMWPAWAAGPAERGPSDRPASATVVTGFTTPFRTVTLAAVRTGRINELPVREGDFIQAGHDALKLDDTVQVRRVEIARVLAESTVEIRIAEVRLDQARRELARLEELRDSASVSAKELSDARTEAEAARLGLEQARLKREQARREYALQQALLTELSVRAPFSGYVAERLKEVGDTVEEREGVLKLVQLDPLLVTLDCPLELLPLVRVGQCLGVQPCGEQDTARVGEVVFVNRVADPASQTFKVKIRVSNADADWVAGTQVAVDFSRAAAAVADQRGQTLAGPLAQVDDADWPPRFRKQR